MHKVACYEPALDVDILIADPLQSLLPRFKREIAVGQGSRRDDDLSRTLAKPFEKKVLLLSVLSRPLPTRCHSCCWRIEAKTPEAMTCYLKSFSQRFPHNHRLSVEKQGTLETRSAIDAETLLLNGSNSSPIERTIDVLDGVLPDGQPVELPGLCNEEPSSLTGPTENLPHKS